MTQENKNLLFKDLCARIPYGVKCQYIDSFGDKRCDELFSVTRTEAEFTEIVPLERVRPYLRPMSSMTEEEENELTAICVRGGYKDTVFKSYLVDDWLNAHHFDYRGLIEKGLARKAPEGMYKTK